MTTKALSVSISSWENGGRIPAKFAFGKIPDEGRFELGGNVSPAIAWNDAPEGSKSYAVICHDPDVPSVADDVNQEGKVVSADLPRVDFHHWVLANIPAEITGLAEGEASQGVTPRGKSPGKKGYGQAGLNNYTQWFAGDPDMEGDYADYDGPCPPWNDSLLHHYYFSVYALNVEKLQLPEVFDAGDVIKAMDGCIIAKGEWMGTYSMNPEIEA